MFCYQSAERTEPVLSQHYLSYCSQPAEGNVSLNLFYKQKEFKNLHNSFPVLLKAGKIYW